MIILRSREKYYPEQGHLVQKNIFETKRVPFEEIRAVEEVKNSGMQRLIIGFPEKSLKVRYQKYEELLLHPERLEELKSEIQKVIPSNS